MAIRTHQTLNINDEILKVNVLFFEAKNLERITNSQVKSSIDGPSSCAYAI